MSAVLLLLLVTLHSLKALEPAHLQPGALTAQIGTVTLIEDSVWVKYQYSTLTDVPDRLGVVADKISTQLDEVEKRLPSYTLVLRERLEQLRDLILSEQGNYEGMHLGTRSKRGLFDGIGHLSRAVFGTALDSDVQTLRNKYNHLASTAMSNSKSIRLTAKNVQALDSNLHKLIAHTRRVEANINKALATLNYRSYMLDILITLSSLENLVRNVIHMNKQLLSNVVDASHSRVSPSLLPVEDLLHALSVGEETYNLKPILGKTGLVHYYPLLSAMLTSDSIIVIIPFKSDHTFLAHSIVPFPTSINKTIITLDLPSMVVVMNEQRTLYTTTSHEEFETCKVERFGISYCPASLFAFLPVDPAGVCEILLTMQDASRCLSLCPYTQLVYRPFFHKSFLDHHYFLFIDPTYVSVSCQSNHTVQKVSGHFAILKLCTLRSKEVNTLPERLQEGFITNASKLIVNLDALDKLVFNSTSIQFVTNSISPLNLTNLTRLESVVHDSLPAYIKPHVHYPSVLIPFVVLLAIVVLLSCLVRKALTLYNALNARVILRASATQSTPNTDSHTDVSR